jgi:hypothetical protein
MDFPTTVELIDVPTIPSVNIKVKTTSMTLPLGAVMSNKSVDVASVTQNDAKLWGGGRVLIFAGTDTDIVVSDTAVFGLCGPPNQLTLHVAVDPWDAGGVQIRIEFSLTVAATAYKLVVKTAMFPHAAIRSPE